MPEFLQLVSALREQMNATLSRSDALKPLAWLVGLLVMGTTCLTIWKAPEWLLIGSSCCLFFSVLTYAAAYFYFLVNDRDALRSEKYSLHKMAIEHGLYGDSNSGVMTPPVADVTPRGQGVTSENASVRQLGSHE